jgi:hypothetical protein
MHSKVLNTCVANPIEIWILAHLHGYFVLRNSKEVQVEFVFYYLLTTYTTYHMHSNFKSYYYEAFNYKRSSTDTNLTLLIDLASSEFLAISDWQYKMTLPNSRRYNG